MSEEITTETTDIETPATEVDIEPQGKDDTDWKSEARKWESRAKADHDAAKQWREYETSQKSDHEKLADELARVKAEASQASLTLLRYEVATEKGLHGAALDLLTGSTREELEANAEKLNSLIENQSKTKTLIPDTNQGKPSVAVVGQLTQTDLDTMSPSEIMKAKANGQLDELLGKR